MAEASDYFLTGKQLRDRFEERVRDFVFSGYAPQDTPALVLLGGQPAAGKSQAMAAAEQRHADRQLVPLTGDELRQFHPQYEELLEEHPLLFPNATAQASGAWVRMSIDYARDHGYSLILEGVFRNPAVTVATAEEFAGLDDVAYTVEVVALGVRAERSRLDSLHRYLEAERWTPPTAHDGSYRMMPETIAAAEASPAVHRLTLTDRSGADLYVNERRTDGSWGREPAGVEALQAIRARPLPADEVAGWLARHREIVVEFAVRGEINAATVPVLNQVAADADVVAAMDPDPQSPARREYAAVRPLLQILVSGPIDSAGSMPLPLVPDAALAAAVNRSRIDAMHLAAELERRRGLAPADRQAEDTLRANLETRLRAAGSPSAPKPPSGSGPASRPSSAAARSRSTTVRKPPPSGKDRSAAPGAADQPPHLRRPGPDQSRRRGPSV